MQLKNLLLYILSGTGNSFRVGCWIKERIEAEGGAVQLRMIDEAGPCADLADSNPLGLGFLFPTHGFMPPWSMIKFLCCFPRANGQSAFCAATRGSIVLGPLLVPGAAGFATFFAALILRVKGYRITGIFSLDMPSNLINFHWGLHPKNTQKILLNTKKRLYQFLIRLQVGKSIYFTLNNLWELLWTGLIFWLIPVFPVLYLIFGRLFMAKLLFSNNKCVGCGLCAKSCGNRGIKMIAIGKRKYPFWTYHCENCLRCMAFCNHKAVEAGHSWGVALYYITSVPVIFWVSLWLYDRFPGIPRIESYWVNQFISLIYFLPALMISYRLFWYLLRIKPINSLFSYTTLTRYFRRYHEPETKLKHLRGRKKDQTKEQKRND